jgi:hypothetical protein
MQFDRNFKCSHSQTSRTNYHSSHRPHEKGFLFDIVTNNRNGIDVDKLSYFNCEWVWSSEYRHHCIFPISDLLRYSGLITFTAILIWLGIQSTSVLFGEVLFPYCVSLTDVCHRLINSSRVLDDQICYNIKDANQVYELCASRFKLHNTLYNHEVVKAIESMIIDGFLAAEPYMKMAERTFDAHKYLYLTDNILNSIQSSEEPVRHISRVFVFSFAL